MGIEVLLTLIKFGNDLANDLEHGLRNVSEAHFLLIFQAFYKP